MEGGFLSSLPLFIDPRKDQRANGQDSHEKTENKEERFAHFPFLPACIRAPKERIDGTQTATKSPASLSPENHKYTESKKERPAAIKIVNLLIRMALPIINSLRCINCAYLIVNLLNTVRL